MSDAGQPIAIVAVALSPLQVTITVPFPRVVYSAICQVHDARPSGPAVMVVRSAPVPVVPSGVV
ncbi:MAG TPA: hypothetical protein VHL09_11840 [Dehalococcoidia bacterium]|nr:hypothetical protein [Dehalococcoidia bacterium]